MSVVDDAVAALAADDVHGVWSAPGRVNLIGEHTDYNDGFVLPFAIEHRTAAAVSRRGDGIIEVSSTFGGDSVAVSIAELGAVFGTRDRPGAPGSAVTSGRVPEWAAYPLGVAWAAMEHTGARAADLPGLTLAFSSEVPVGAGLSSSAAIEGATAAALRDEWSLDLDGLDIARIGRRAENDAVGAPTGIMDQVASTLGEADSAILLDCRSLVTDVVPMGLTAAGLTVLVTDTRVSHAHATGGYGARRASCERAVAALGLTSLRDLTEAELPAARAQLDDETYRRVRHVVTENQRVLDTARVLREVGPRGIGDLLVASHASMRDDYEISIPELDLAVDTALAAGAVGARMTGGGFGGSAISLVDIDDADRIAAEVRAAFAAAGFAAPHTFTVRPAEGIRRDR